MLPFADMMISREPNLVLRFITLGMLLLAARSAAAVPEMTAFRLGKVWLDTAGQAIQAHGGGILLHSNVYYWHGEDRTPSGHGAVAAYSSTNLYEWEREGVVLFRLVGLTVHQQVALVVKLSSRTPKVVTTSSSGSPSSSSVLRN